MDTNQPPPKVGRHQGDDNWEHDLATTNTRALAAIAARAYKKPRPTWGRHNRAQQRSTR